MPDSPTPVGALTVVLNQRSATPPYHRSAIALDGDEHPGKAIGFDDAGALTAIAVGAEDNTGIVNVKDHGAVGDGASAALDTAGAIAAIAALSSVGGTVYFPPGLYLINATLAITLRDVTLQGAGGNATQLYFFNEDIGIDVGNGTDFIEAFTLRNICLRGDQTRPDIGIRMRKAYQVCLESVHFGDFPTFLDLDGGNMRISTCQFAQNVSDYTLAHILLRNFTGITISACVFEGNTGAGCSLIKAIGTSMVELAIEGCIARGGHTCFIDIATATAGALSHLSVVGNVDTFCTGFGFVAAGALTVNDAVFSGNTWGGGSVPTPNFVGIKNPGNRAVIIGNCLRSGLYGIYLEGNTNITVLGNYLEGTINSIRDQASTSGTISGNTLTGPMTQAGTAVSYWGNKIGGELGFKSLSPSGAPQIMAAYSDAQYASITVNSAGNATYATTGTVSIFSGGLVAGGTLYSALVASPDEGSGNSLRFPGSSITQFYNSSLLTMSISAARDVRIDSGKFSIAAGSAPASAGATGIAGQIAWDSGFIYVCVAGDTWKRAALSSW